MSAAPLMLSVSGMRGLIGQSLTPVVATRYAAAFGSWLKESTGKDHPLVVIGRDSRPSGDMLERAAVAGLTATGCQVVTLGIVTTPSTAIMVDQLKADGGMIVTASHNPIIWNGLKALRHDGAAPPPDQAQQIIDRFHADRYDNVDVELLQPICHDPTANQVHLDRVLKHLDVDAIRSRRPKVVLDSVHGAGGPVARMLLDQLGVELVHLYAEPTGQFPHTPEPTRANLTGLCEAVREHGADLGFAQDPDADRLAVVDENGTYIGEEYTLALAAMHVLEREPGPAVANLSTSRMLEDIAEQRGCEVHRTPVGEANVASAMRATSATVGGEGNGGIIWPKVVYVRDSIAGIGLVLELLARSGNKLSELVARIPAYVIEKDKLPIREGMVEPAIEQLKLQYASEKIDLQDGIRIDFADRRWVSLRASNTEPIMRIIAEAPDATAARQLIEDVRKVLSS